MQVTPERPCTPLIQVSKSGCLALSALIPESGWTQFLLESERLLLIEGIYLFGQQSPVPGKDNPLAGRLDEVSRVTLGAHIAPHFLAGRFGKIYFTAFHGLDKGGIDHPQIHGLRVVAVGAHDRVLHPFQQVGQGRLRIVVSHIAVDIDQVRGFAGHAAARCLRADSSLFLSDPGAHTGVLGGRYSLC